MELNERKHNERCEHAKSKVCRCSCGGSKHGIKNEELDHAIGERYITLALGGELADEIKKIDGKRMLCFCGKSYQLGTYRGYPHTEGLADASGNRWWMSVKCPYCNYDMSFGKIEHRIEALEYEKERHGEN